MQTFLPFPDFFASASVLDRQRLGKQRVETMQLLRLVTTPKELLRGWKNHPARRMWCGFPEALGFYGVVMIRRWLSFGYRDTCREKILSMLGEHGYSGSEKKLEERYEAALAGTDRAFLPPWFGDEAFHRSHRSNLLRKEPQWYGQFGWTEPADLAYEWPDGGCAGEPE